MKMSIAVANASGRSNAFGSSTFEAVMKKAIVGLVAAAAASTVFAQDAMQSPAAKAKQQLVASITGQAAEGADVSPIAAGIAAESDRAMKSEPKVLTTDKERQLVVESVTIPGAGGGYRTKMDGLKANQLRATTGEPKVLTSWKEKQTTVQKATVGQA